ncbi:unnamed protein product [Paramecium octaurelia]|uniref:Sperm-tail PG-rich repeat-containing protein 2 n=1 Tax=Paramecium octaurelia TaxID=43137 RepID=A0A8S1STT8_PAROT|nr:unnamed protein product [Paramecium octaurelia]
MIHGPNSSFSGAFSIGKKIQALGTQNNTPGPDHYNLTTPQSSGFKFSKSVRKQLYEPKPIPEPGAYDPNLSIIQPNPPNIKFSKAQEQEKLPLDIGPGTYNWSDQKKSPAFTFQNKFENPGNDVLNTPGPGHYDIKESHSLQPINKGFTTSTRLNMLLSNGPGPGSYNLETLKVQTSMKFPKQQRTIDKLDPTPGPGAFLTVVQSKQGISFGKKLQAQSEKQFVPGPGTYQLKSFAEQISKGTKIGTSNRSQMLLQQGPSPLNYDISQYKPPSKYSSFGNAERKTMQEKSEYTPGPGTYYLGVSLSKLGPVIGKSSKEQMVIHDSLPGPGKYNLNDTFSRGPSYHIAGKHEKQQEQSLVGPGRYQINRDITDGPKFKFSTKEKTDSKDHSQSQFYDIQASLGFIPKYLLQN